MTVPPEGTNIYAVPSMAPLIAGQSAASKEAEATARADSLVDVLH